MTAAMLNAADQPAIAAPPTTGPSVRRLISLDAYRGLVMLAMASSGLGLAKVAGHFPGSRAWQLLAYESEHVRWRGCALWDLIQPSFFFIVGVAVPFSIASRLARGQSWGRMFAHTLWRSLLLVLLGVFMFSEGERQTNWIFMNTLAQIGLAYTFVFLLAGAPRRVQLAAIFAILAGYWCFFYFHPLPAPGTDLADLGVPKGWQPMAGMAAHWDIGVNPGVTFDRWFLNLFPRPAPFRFREGGGNTLNFIPTIATMGIGVLAGQVLLAAGSDQRKLMWLLRTGVLCMLAGVAMDPSILPGVETTRWTLCPIVKRIWTPSWAVYTAGIATLVLAVMYWVVEMRGWRRWAFPLVVVGMNSIAMFCLASLSPAWIRGTLYTHVGQKPFSGVYGPIWLSLVILAVLWLACWWMYRKRIFIRI